MESKRERKTNYVVGQKKLDPNKPPKAPKVPKNIVMSVTMSYVLDLLAHITLQSRPPVFPSYCQRAPRARTCRLEARERHCSDETGAKRRRDLRTSWSRTRQGARLDWHRWVITFNRLVNTHLLWYGAEPLAEQEQEQKQEAMRLGFEDWTRRDYQQFVKGVEQYGKSVQPTLELTCGLMCHM